MMFNVYNFDSSKLYSARVYSVGYYSFEEYHEIHVGFWKWRISLTWESNA